MRLRLVVSLGRAADDCMVDIAAYRASGALSTSVGLIELTVPTFHCHGKLCSGTILSPAAAVEDSAQIAVGRR